MSNPVYSEPVTLSEKITRGSGDSKQVIEKVKLRKPTAGELRGLRLVEVANADVDSMITLIPRLSEPALTEMDVTNMDPADFTEVSLAVVTFLEAKKPTPKK